MRRRTRGRVREGVGSRRQAGLLACREAGRERMPPGAGASVLPGRTTLLPTHTSTHHPPKQPGSTHLSQLKPCSRISSPEPSGWIASRSSGFRLSGTMFRCTSGGACWAGACCFWISRTSVSTDSCSAGADSEGAAAAARVPSRA